MTFESQFVGGSDNRHPSENPTTKLFEQFCHLGGGGGGNDCNNNSQTETTSCSDSSMTGTQPVGMKFNGDICSWRPDFSLSTPLARAWEAQSNINRNQPLDLSGCDNYTVKFGDCLWTIADRALKKDGDQNPNGTEIEDEIKKIVQLNKEAYPSLKCNPDLIMPGWKLKIPGKMSCEPEPCNPEPCHPAPPEHCQPKPEKPSPSCPDKPDKPDKPCPPHQPPEKPPCPPEQPPCPPERPPCP
ncbi:MAG TPA: LysM peptidoglycan-binding domain-containing protein, partial [Chroococcales cyanobacterium]